MITSENITVPANIRKQFDTSKINTSINNLEEILKDNQVLGDSPYIPTPDERSLNVIQRIKETSTYYQEEEEDSVGVAYTNTWEYREGVTTHVAFGEYHVCVVSNSVRDPGLLHGAIITNATGEESEITEEPTEFDSYYYTGSDVGVIIVIPEDALIEGIEVPAGTYIACTLENIPNIVKIVAKSNIFPVQ